MNTMNIATVDLNLLKVFEALHEESSASRAALRLGVTQSAVSAALRRLRELYGDQLFVRTGRGLAPTLKANQLKPVVSDALDIFFDVRSVPGLKKKPSTSELIDWLKLLMADDIPDEVLKNHDASKAIPPLYGALVKNEQDVHLLERLAFMHRRESRR